MASDELDEIQRQVPACNTLAYADLSTEMVLITNSDTPLERHGLNRLCSEAVLLLGAGGATRTQSALVSTQDEIRFFLRSDLHPTDVLICVGGSDLDLSALRPLASAFLRRQGAAG